MKKLSLALIVLSFIGSSAYAREARDAWTGKQDPINFQPDTSSKYDRQPESLKSDESGDYQKATYQRDDDNRVLRRVHDRVM